MSPLADARVRVDVRPPCLVGSRHDASGRRRRVRARSFRCLGHVTSLCASPHDPGGERLRGWFERAHDRNARTISEPDVALAWNVRDPDDYSHRLVRRTTQSIRLIAADPPRPPW